MAETKNKSKASSMPFEDLFLDQIKDIYWAEKALVKALPELKKAATSEALKKAIKQHITETEHHVIRLEKVFELLEKKAAGSKCEAMEGLIEEGLEILQNTESSPMVKDAGIILAAQKVEHYEIATYGTLHEFAIKLGYNAIATLLSDTLEEEKNADAILTGIALEEVNAQAVDEY